MKPKQQTLEFPVWPEVAIHPKRMSLGEYAAFIEFCWMNLPHKARVLEARLHDVPTVPFVIR